MMFEVPDPITEAVERLRAMRLGQWEGVSALEAEGATLAARDDLSSGFGGRRLGYALIKAKAQYDGGDWQEALVAISDGERDGAVVASLNMSQVAASENRGEDPMEVLVQRLRDMLIPNSASHFDQVALASPIRL